MTTPNTGSHRQPVPLEGWWKPVPDSHQPGVRGKIEREPNPPHGYDDELDVLIRGIDAPAGAPLEVVHDDTVVASAPLQHHRVFFGLGGTDGRARITVDAAGLPPMRSGDRVTLRVSGQAVATAELRPD